VSSVDPSLSNQDLRPVPLEKRNWTFYNYMALWFSMCMEITTYRLASGLIAKGMDWKQAIGTVLLGNVIVLVPMLLNAHAGAKYGIPFPVLLRASFGVRGANIAALLRAVVACGWFGIQAWIGGSAIDAMLVVIWPRLDGNGGVLWACFLGFWLLNMVVVWRGVDSIRRLQAFGAPFMFVMAAALLVWVRVKAGSFGAMLSTPSQFHTRRISERVFSVADGDGGLLGDAGAEYSRFHALFEITERAELGTGVRAAGGDGDVHVSWDRSDFGVGGAVWQADLGPGATDWNVS